MRYIKSNVSKAIGSTIPIFILFMGSINHQKMGGLLSLHQNYNGYIYIYTYIFTHTHTIYIHIYSGIKWVHNKI